MTHDLKIAPPFFTQVRLKNKPFELRKNDRSYAVGDTLRLREWSAYAHRINGDGYTGRVITATVSYVLDGGGLGLDIDYCILGLRGIIDCTEAGETRDGKCIGFQKDEHNDEPCERCMNCPRNQFYEEDSQ